MRMFFARTKIEHEGDNKMVSGTSAVETPVRNFVSELAEAERLAQSTEVAERLARAAVKTQENLITGAENDLRWERGTTEANHQIISNAKSNLRLRLADLPKATTEAEKAKADLEHLKYEIANHPLTVTARAKQRTMCEKAAELGRRAWHDTPILKLDTIKQQIDSLIDEEAELLTKEGEKLKAAGLPLLLPRISGASMNMLPSFVWDRALNAIASDAAAARRRLAEF